MIRHLVIILLWKAIKILTPKKSLLYLNKNNLFLIKSEEDINHVESTMRKTYNKVTYVTNVIPESKIIVNGNSIREI